MFERILVLFQHCFDRPRQALLESAIRTFQSRAQDQVHRGLSRVIYEDDEQQIVRVCYGDVRPPHRAWFLVKARGEDVTEIPFDSVVQYGEHAWR